MPDNRADFQKTTCRHPYCSAPDRVFAPGAYRVSIERSANFEDSSTFSQQIPLKPLYPWGPGLKSGKYSVPKRGLGEDMLAWWCLACLESVWLEGNGFIKFRYQYKRSEDPELWELLANMRPEARSRGEQNRLYHLSDLRTQAVEAWRWAQDYQWEANYGAGPDPSAGNPDLVDLESLDGTTGQTIKISLHRVAEKTLSEILRVVDEKIERERQSSRQANQSAPDETLRTENPLASESTATVLDMSPESASPDETVSSGQPDVQRVTKKRSANNTSEEKGSRMDTTAEESGAPRSIKKHKLETEQPKDTRPVQSFDGDSPPKRAQRLKLNPPKKPCSSHDPGVAVTSGMETQEHMQDSGDSTRNPSHKAEGATRKTKLRLTFKAGQT